MNILRKTKETIAGGGLFLALLALSISGTSLAAPGCNLQLVDDYDYTSTEIVVENDLVNPSWPDGREITIDGTTYKKTASTRIESQHIVIEPGIKTGDLDPTGMKTLLTGEEIAALTGDDNYRWPDGKSKTLIASADLDINPSGKTLIAGADGALMNGIVEGGGKTDGLVGADDTSLAWSADPYTV